MNDTEIASSTAWKMRCPKCKSTDFAVTTDRTTPIAAGKYDYVLHCRCGKILYGEANIRAEHDRQLEAYTLELKELGLTPEKVARKKAEDARKKAEEEESRACHAQEARRKQNDAREAATAVSRLLALERLKEWNRVQEAAANGLDPGPRPVRLRLVPPVVEVKRQEPPAPARKKRVEVLPAAASCVCAWPTCGKPTDGKSKYCSRTCSNRYSHLRADLRVKVGKLGREVAIDELASKWKVETKFVELVLAS